MHPSLASRRGGAKTLLQGSVLRTSLTQLAGFDCCRFRMILDHLVLRSSSWTCCHSNRSINLNLVVGRARLRETLKQSKQMCRGFETFRHPSLRWHLVVIFKYCSNSIDKETVKGIVHFEIKIWYLSAYPKGIQDVGVFFSSVDPILMFLGQTVLVCQSYNGRY